MPPRFSDLLLQIIHRDPSRIEPRAFSGFSSAGWREFVAEAIRYRLAFQVLRFLSGTPQPVPRVPPESLEQLKTSVRSTLMANLRQQGHLKKMVTACEAENIPVIMLKGLWLSETVFRDPKARLTGDIDLLFRREDMPRFTLLARRLGFNIPAEIRDLAAVDASHNEYPLRHPKDGSYFDVHWALTHPETETPIDEFRLWQRSDLFSIGGILVRSLCVEDHLLYICFHAAAHHRFDYVGPRALLDVAQLVSSPPRAIDWDEVVHRSFELGWSRSVWIMLAMAQRYLGTVVPQRVLVALQPEDSLGVLEQDILQAALEALFLTQRHGDRLSDNVVRLIEEPSWAERMKIALGRVFPSRQEIAQGSGPDVSGWQLYRLYTRRLRRLAREHAPGLVQVAYGSAQRKAELNRTKLLGNWLDQGSTVQSSHHVDHGKSP